MSRLGSLLSRLRPTRAPGPAPSAVDDGGIYDGTVGWEDGKSHYDVDDGQVPFVKVRLFLGHNPVTEGENRNPARAAGRKIVARIDPKSSDIPEDGETVIVAVPKGRSNVPGAAMIIGRPNPDPKWIPNRKAGEKMLFGPNDSFIRFKDDGTIFLFVKDGPGDGAKPIYVKLHAKGFEVRHPHGRMRSDDLGFEMAHSSGATVSGGAVSGLPAPLDALSSFLNLEAAIVKIKATAMTIGGSSGQDNILKAVPTFGAISSMQAAMVSMQAALALVGTALSAITAIGVNATAAPAAAAAVTGIGTSATAVTASGSAVTTAAVNAPTKALTVG